MDPNDIVGPSGVGSAGFILPESGLPYIINFENKADASAWAAEVVVTHGLDADLDLDTFQLGNVGFGDIQVEVPAGKQTYHTRLDLRSSMGVFVDVDANLNRASRTVTWTLRAIDPTTLDLPSDPFVGILPPNQVSPEGQGYVTYFVQPKAGLASGTRIEAQASIVFDVNDPIVTNTWLNTIDTAPPSSQVSSLAANSPAPFSVSWVGVDDAGGTAGSGIASYDIYVSDDNGPYTLWLDDVTESSADFNGVTGHTYRFYSVAVDRVGHVEAAPATADATTIVNTSSVDLSVDAGPDQNWREGDLVSLPGASITYTGNVADVSLTIDWGDGTIEPGAITWQSGAGKVTSTHRYVDNGNYLATLHVFGAQATESQDAIRFAVANIAPVVTLGGDVKLSAGQTLVRGGSFIDPGADTWTASVDYGTGAGFVPLALNTDKTFALDHAYSTMGSYTVKVRVTDDDGAPRRSSSR